MEYAIVVVKQVIVMFILIAIGVISRKKNLLTKEATRILSNFVLNIITPCLIINAFSREYNDKDTRGLILAFILAIVFFIIATTTVNIFIRKNKDNKYRIERLATVYSNCGFMAFPLLTAVLGEHSVFFGTAFVTVFNLFLWSNGIAILSSHKDLSFKKIFINPGTIGTYIGLLIYFLRIPVPVVISDTIGHLNNLNTPLGMIITGVFLAEVNVKSIPKNYRMYYVSLLRLIVYPVIFLFLIKVFGVATLFGQAKIVAVVSVICSACPSAASVILLSAKMDLDESYGAELLSATTLLSIISLPIMAVISNAIL